MRLEVWEDGGPKEVVGILRLFKEVGRVAVRVVDSSGQPIKQGALAIFRPGGELRLPAGIDPALGFQLTKQRRIKHSPCGADDV